MRFLLTLLLTIVMGSSSPAQETKLIRVGIIGCDTSHVTAFTNILHDKSNADRFGSIRVVAAFPGGSVDIPSSKNRVEGYVKELKEKHQVTIYETVEEMLKQVDVVLLESVDGRPHLQQATLVINAKKPLFIDKPVAGSLKDAVKLYRLAKEANVPIFSSSALRFCKGIAEAKTNPKIGKIVGCDAWCPCELEEHHPDLFWYGVHGVETLYTIMGMGCETVTRTKTTGTDLVTGVWKEGRIGTFRGIRQGKHDYGAMAFGTAGNQSVGGFTGYDPLVHEIVRFFRSGTVPVSAEETLEIFTFMEAAEVSAKRGGIPVKLKEVLEEASK